MLWHGHGFAWTGPGAGGYLHPRLARCGWGFLENMSKPSMCLEFRFCPGRFFFSVWVVTFQQSVSAFTMNVLTRVNLFLHTPLLSFPLRVSFLLSWPSGFFLVRKKSATFVISVRSCLGGAHISGSGLERSSVKVNLKAESWRLANVFWEPSVLLKPPKDIQALCSGCTQPRNETVLIFLTQRWASWQMDRTQCMGCLLYITHRPATCRHIAVGHVHIYSDSQREMGGDRGVITGVVVISCKECFFSLHVDQSHCK